MRQSGTVLTIALLACASSTPLRLDRVHGVYTTHFGGIPDDAAVCAVVHNAGSRPLAWLRLRLRATSQLGDEPARWTATWIYAEALPPGESVALELGDPPMADTMELRVQDAGGGRPPRAIRRARRSGSCSEAGLEQALAARRAGREAPGLAVHPIAQRASRGEDVLVAHQDEPVPASAN